MNNTMTNGLPNTMTEDERQAYNIVLGKPKRKATKACTISGVVYWFYDGLWHNKAQPLHIRYLDVQCSQIEDSLQ
jgi:hypothetical protein